MKNILDLGESKDIMVRISKLSSDVIPKWGKMNDQQMLCHVSDQIRMATGEIKAEYIGNPFLKIVAKRLTLLGMPIPKGKIQTTKELNQEKMGTKPSGFEKDRKTLIDLINNFDKNYPDNTKICHPAFGPMTKKQWGRLIYLHLHHHLQQFGV